MSYAKLYITSAYHSHTRETASKDYTYIKRLISQIRQGDGDHIRLTGDDGYEYLDDGQQLVRCDYLGID